MARGKKEKKDERRTQVELATLYPEPTFDLTPLPSARRIEETLDEFAIIRQITVGTKPTNSTRLGKGKAFLNASHEATTELKARATTNFYPKSSEDGLDKSASREVVTDAYSDPNFDITVEGKDEKGLDIVRKNDSVKIQLAFPVDTQGLSNLRAPALTAYGIFLAAQQNGDIQLKDEQVDPDKIQEEIRRLHNRFR